MDNIYTRLIEVRKSLGLTQKEVSEGAGVALRTYCRYESGEGERDIPSSLLKFIAQNDIDINWLLTGEGTMSSNTRTVQEGDHIDAFDGELPRLACGLYGQGDFVFVPISSEQACCGKGSPIFEEYNISENIAVKRSALGSLSESTH